MTRLLRMTALLLSLMMMASALTSCDLLDRVRQHFSPKTDTVRGIPEDNDLEYVTLDSSEYVYSSYYAPVKPNHSYDMLSEGQQALYDALYNNVRDVYPDSDEDSDDELYKTRQAIVDGYVLSTADIRIAAKALYDDNPDLFWLSSTVYQLTNQYEDYTAVQMRSIYSPEEIKSMQEAINLAANTFFAKIPADLSPYDREKYAHDYIAALCEYDKEAAKVHNSDDRVEEAYIVYGALVKGQAVCEGYARTMQLLLCGVGVDCVGITGIGYDSDGSNDLHMWNAVSLDDDWYYVDPTWDDQLYDYRRYQYFNLDESTLAKDHECSPALADFSEEDLDDDTNFDSVALNLFLPECTATAYAYYRYECPHLTDYDGTEVKEGLYLAALEQQEYFTFYIDPETLDYDETIDVMFKESPQYFFQYAEAVNEWLSDYEIDNSNMSYYPNEDRSAVTVMLNYY